MGDSEALVKVHALVATTRSRLPPCRYGGYSHEKAIVLGSTR